jgi:hypothetical protein
MKWEAGCNVSTYTYMYVINIERLEKRLRIYYPALCVTQTFCNREGTFQTNEMKIVVAGYSLLFCKHHSVGIPWKQL